MWGGGLEEFAGGCADLGPVRVHVELSVGRTVKPQIPNCLEIKSRAYSRCGQVNSGRDGRPQVHAEFYRDET